jgi:hypothetical protein
MLRSCPWGSLIRLNSMKQLYDPENMDFTQMRWVTIISFHPKPGYNHLETVCSLMFSYVKCNVS